MKDYEWLFDATVVIALVLFVANMIGGAV